MTSKSRTAEAPRAGRRIHRDHIQIAGYFGASFLIYYLCLPQGGFADIPIQYLLKDGLKLDAQHVALVRLYIAAPTYIAFLFGFLRDRWAAAGKSDRFMLWIFPPAAFLGYLWMAIGPPAYGRLLVGTLTATVAFRFLGAVTQGLAADVGARRGMTGRLSTLWTTVWSLLAALSYVIGGWVSDHLTFQQTFGLLGLLTLGYFVIGFWAPIAVFDEKSRPADSSRRLWPELVRVVSHRPLWPAAAIWLLWSFAPGFSTPLLFYLTDHIKASATQFGLFNAIFQVSFIPTFLVYGVLCRRTSLNKLLWWGTVFAVPQMVPLLFLQTPRQALLVAVPIGLSGGIATAAYIDLLMRACPKNLEGTGMMIADTGYFIALRAGDVLGSWLYLRGGFALTVWITTGVYALILAIVLLVPASITSAHDADENTEEALVSIGSEA